MVSTVPYDRLNDSFALFPPYPSPNHCPALPFHRYSYWLDYQTTARPYSIDQRGKVGTPVGRFSIYQSPLVCDNTFNGNGSTLQSLQQKIGSVIAEGKNAGSISQASVYFRDLKTSREININGNEKYFPASLKKIPVMMEYYKEAEADPSILSSKKVIADQNDYNADVSVLPKQAPEYGKEYTVQELIDMMIKYSDNNGFETLFQNLGREKYNQVFQDMQLHYPDNVVAIDDYVTPYQFSLFFRTLYNATYLNNQYSEAALKLLSQSDFKDGLVAGVPEQTTVAHKFGLGTVNQGLGGQQGELHDCGIVYNRKNPFLLCVMTKSQSYDITKVEKVIADISAAAFKSADANYK